jgi:hypothetical protein
VNLHDERSVDEQVKSGFRIAGFILLTFVVFLLLVLGTTLVLGDPGRFSGHGLSERVTGGCILLALSAFLFFTVRYWAPWFIAFVLSGVFKLALLGILGITSVRGSRPVSRSWILEVVLILAVLTALAVKPVYGDERITRIESAALVCSVLALVFLLIKESAVPLAVATGVLAIGRLVEWERAEERKERRHGIKQPGQQFGESPR